MFWEDKRPLAVQKEELALCDFNLEDDDDLDYSIMGFFLGNFYTRWIFHAIIANFFLFLVYFFNPYILFILIFEFVAYWSERLMIEELLSFEFYWVTQQFMLEPQGGIKHMWYHTVVIYNRLGYVIWGINSIADYCNNLFDFNFSENSIGLYNYYKKSIKNENLNDFIVIEEDEYLNTILNIDNKDNIYYEKYDVLKLYYYNNNIIKILKNKKIIKNKKINYFIAYNKDKDLTWFDYHNLLKNEDYLNNPNIIVNK